MRNPLDDNLKRYEEARATGTPIYLEPDDLTDIAEYYHLHGRQAEAYEALDRAITMFPGATIPLAFRARLAILADHDTDEATRWAEQIADKTDLEYYYLIAEIMVARVQPNEADEYLRSVEATLDDEDLEDFYIDVATLFSDYAHTRLTEQWLAKSSETDDPQYRELTARIALANGNFDDCERIINSLIDEDPYNTDYWNTMAIMQYQKNDLQASLESSDYALAIAPHCAEANINKANALALMGNYPEAVRYYQKYKKLQPYSESGDIGLASVLTAQNRYEEALCHLERAERLAPPGSFNLLEILRQECILNAQLGRNDKSWACVRRIDEHPDHNTPEDDVLRGYIYLVAGDSEKAHAWFMRALEASGSDLHVQTLIAYSTYECGYTQFAHDLFQEIMHSQLAANVPEGWAFLALCDADLGLRSEFLDDLHRAVEANAPQTNMLLKPLFPEGVPLERYEDYAREHPEMAAWPSTENPQ